MDFVIPAEPEYKRRFLEDLKSKYAGTRCEAIHNLVSYPGEDTVRGLRPMLLDPATSEIKNYDGEGKTVTYYPVRQCAYLAMTLLGEEVDRPVPFLDQMPTMSFKTGFENRVYFPHGNWKRFEDIAAPPPASPFEFLKGQKPVKESHDWRHLDYAFAIQADFAANAQER